MLTRLKKAKLKADSEKSNQKSDASVQAELSSLESIASATQENVSPVVLLPAFPSPSRGGVSVPFVVVACSARLISASTPVLVGGDVVEVNVCLLGHAVYLGKYTIFY